MALPQIPEALAPLSVLPRGDAEDAVDRTLKTTHDAIRFTAALAEALGPRGYEDPWVKPGGSRRLYAFDPDRPGWVVAQCLLELALDTTVPPPIEHVLLPDGTKVKWSDDRPKAQPEGPDQRSAELRLIFGERTAQWAYDEVGRCRERMRGRGDGDDDALPFLSDRRRLDRDQQRPHPLFLRGDLDAFGHSPRELAGMFAELDFRTFSRIRVRVPHPMPGGPALAARRAVWELKRASFEGRWSYPGAGWVVLDGYLADVKATGATFESAFAAWQDAVGVYNPIPRDSRMTAEEIARAEREFERSLEEEAAAAEDEPDVERLPDGATRFSHRVVIRWVPPVKMPFPPHRPECAPAVAIPLPEAPVLPETWRAAGFAEVVRLIDEEGTVAHGFLAREADRGHWFVGEAAARHLDPATLREHVRSVEAAAEREDLERWGGPFPGMPTDTPWLTSHFTMLADGGRRLGPLKRNSVSAGKGPETGGYEPPQAFSVAWSRPRRAPGP